MKKGKKIVHKIENIFGKKEEKEQEINNSDNNMVRERKVDDANLEVNKEQLIESKVFSSQEEEAINTEKEWKNIHPDFTPELQKEWEDRGFSYEGCKEWIDYGSNIGGFKGGLTISEADFADYLKKIDEKATRWSGFLDFEKLRKSYTAYLKLKKIHPEFSPRLQKLWEKHEFTVLTIQQWIKQGLIPTDYDLANYFKKKNISSQQKLDIAKLSEEYKNNLDLKNIYPWISQERWEKFGFTYYEVKTLIEKEFEFCYAKEWKKLGFTSVKILEWVKTGLREDEYEFANYLKQKGYQTCDPNIKEIIKKESWRNVHRDFNYLQRGRWESRGFTAEQVQEWIEAGLQVYHSNYASWLRDFKKLNAGEYQTISKRKELEKECIYAEKELSERELQKECFQPDNQIINQIKNFEKNNNSWYRRLTFEQKAEQEMLWRELIPNEKLRENYKHYRKYGLCIECQQPRNDRDWCRPCNAKRFQQNFKNWTSGNPYIDVFIQDSQLKATSAGKVLEWIPCEKLSSIEYFAEGGFGKVYKAWWPESSIKCWSAKYDRWEREEETYSHGRVALKSLNNSQNITTEFLQEVSNNLSFNSNLIIPCYGISQDPETGNYLMVMNYKKDGNLRMSLDGDPFDIHQLSKLYRVANGIHAIHKKGFIHRDFHAGNILNGTINIHERGCYITDLGLCRPAGETDKSKIYGVLPYIAPEVLCGKPYTQASDIYSLGIIAYEILTGLPVYHDIPHDESLVKRICQGLRPQFKIKIPLSFKNLIDQCWDADPLRRPTADQLYEFSSKWEHQIRGDYEKDRDEIVRDREKIKDGDCSEIYRQCREAIEFNKKLSISKINISNEKSPPYYTHSRATYISRLLCFKDLPQPCNNPSQQWQTATLLTLQIRGTEEEIKLLKESLNNGLKGLVDQFIEVKKQTLKNKANEELEKNAWDLEDKLEEKNLSREKIDEIIRRCEDLVKLEQEQLQAQVEIPTNK